MGRSQSVAREFSDPFGSREELLGINVDRVACGKGVADLSRIGNQVILNKQRDRDASGTRTREVSRVRPGIVAPSAIPGFSLGVQEIGRQMVRECELSLVGEHPKEAPSGDSDRFEGTAVGVSDCGRAFKNPVDIRRESLQNGGQVCSGERGEHSFDDGGIG